MATRRFDTTYSFTQARADAVIRCRSCGHEHKVHGPDFLKMFGMPQPLNVAKKRLRCLLCGGRDADVIPAPQLER